MENIIIKKKGANFFGFETVGKGGKTHWELWFIHGNGDLRLTDKGLYFSMWLPKKEIFIPIEKIKKVEIRNSHNGRWSVFKILRVFFEEGDEIKIFGAVIGLRKTALEWKNRIEELIGAVDGGQKIS